MRHPRPADPTAELVRLRARTGPTALLGAAWTDPDDVRPSAARTARTVTGFRSFCPLRWAITRRGGSTELTERHVWAADKLRAAFDLAVLGATGARDMVPILAIVYGPRAGFSAAASAQPRAMREVRRAMALFRTIEREQLTMVVLFNRSVAEWCRIRRECGHSADPAAEMRRLVGSLGRLEAHYATEIDEDLAAGRLIAA